MFCHWLVAEKHYLDTGSARESTESVEPASSPILAEPWATIFADYAEAEWAFGLLSHMADRLELTGPDDPRFSCSLRYGGRALHVNYCNWYLAGFYGPGFRDYRVGLTIRKDRDAFGDLSQRRGFKTRPDEPGAAFAYPPVEEAQNMTPAQWAVLDETLDYVADRFEAYRYCRYRHAHVPEIGRQGCGSRTGRVLRTGGCG